MITGIKLFLLRSYFFVVKLGSGTRTLISISLTRSQVPKQNAVEVTNLLVTLNSIIAININDCQQISGFTSTSKEGFCFNCKT